MKCKKESSVPCKTEWNFNFFLLKVYKANKKLVNYYKRAPQGARKKTAVFRLLFSGIYTFKTTYMVTFP